MLSYQPEYFTRYLRANNEDSVKSLTKKHKQISHTCFLEQYGSLCLYTIGIERRYTIDDEDIYCLNKVWYDLIGNQGILDGTSTDHAYFLIHDDLFEIILKLTRIQIFY